MFTKISTIFCVYFAFALIYSWSTGAHLAAMSTFALLFTHAGILITHRTAGVSRDEREVAFWTYLDSIRYITEAEYLSERRASRWAILANAVATLFCTAAAYAVLVFVLDVFSVAHPLGTPFGSTASTSPAVPFVLPALASCAVYWAWSQHQHHYWTVMRVLILHGKVPKSPVFP